MLTTILVAAAEEAEHAEEAHLNPYIFGAVALAILFTLLFVLLAFGKGREHT
ncbi:hypothetical protein [Aeromicrobium sp. Sec7.5]|uniref:hypothetical protein n=1 Tax=Aeromicrobium sp. Sec7.5 TaxID=3121276 RepID=UPI002FE4EF67